VYLDPCVFIYPVIYEGGVEEASHSKEVLRRVTEDAVAQGRRLLEFPGLSFIEASEAVVKKAQVLLESYGLGPRDAIHVASTLYAGVKVVVSDDEGFDKVLELRRLTPAEFLRGTGGGCRGQ